ncbi:Ubiquitin-like-specific protease ESD4, partial [Bienertia sinuspersici]
GITPCELALSDPSYRFVASGKVHNFSTGTRVHTNPIPDGYVRVSIDYAIEVNTPLPIPIEGECHVINDAIGTLVLWPIELVVLEKTVVNSLKNQDKHGDILIKTPLSCDIEAQKVDQSERVINVETLLPEMFMFYKCIMKMDCSEQIIVPIDIGVTTQSKTVHVDVFKENGSKGKVFFAPYNAGFHWILCVIDPYNNIVYYLDSLHNQEDIATGKGISEDLREIVDIALFQFRSEIEITRKLKMDTKWITIQVLK